MEILEEVNGWNLAAEERRVVCLVSRCVECGSREVVFYEARDRVFLALVAMMVIRLASYVVRFRCRRCGKRMTQWPPFAVRYGRYVKQVVLELSGAYVEDSKATYRGVAEFIGYEGKTEEIDERKLAPGTVWRWLGKLGKMGSTLQRAKELILEKRPWDDLHRQVEPIPARKYRSKKRKRVLTVARDLMRAERRFVELFGRSCLPGFVTA